MRRDSSKILKLESVEFQLKPSFGLERTPALGIERGNEMKNYWNLTKLLAGIVTALAIGCSGPTTTTSNASPTGGQDVEATLPAVKQLAQSWTLINFGAPW